MDNVTAHAGKSAATMWGIAVWALAMSLWVPEMFSPGLGAALSAAVFTALHAVCAWRATRPEREVRPSR